MTKPQLRDKVDDTAPAEDQEGDGAGSPSRGELQLEADAQKGGHSFTLDGKANSNDVSKYKHGHVKKTWAVKQSGGSSYKEFMRANLKQHGGDMKAAADAYKQSSGHYAKAGGNVTAAEKAKYMYMYKHSHAGMNPAVGESNVYEKRASPKKKKGCQPSALAPSAAKAPAKELIHPHASAHRTARRRAVPQICIHMRVN